MAADNGCLNQNLLNSMYSILFEGFKYNDMSSMARLAMINQYGLYNRPNNKSAAFDIAEASLSTAASEIENDIDTYKKIGFVIPTLYLANYDNRPDDRKNEKLANAVYEFLVAAGPEAISSDDKSSFKKVKHLYYEVLADARINGKYGAQKNVELAISSTYDYEKNLGEEILLDYLISNPGDSDFSNPALLCYFAAVYFEDRYIGYSTDLANIYQQHIDSFKSYEDYAATYKQGSEVFKGIMQNNYGDTYFSIQDVWDFLQDCDIKEPDAYTGWKFLPTSEQNSLYISALDEDSELENKEKFQIFKAMVANGDNKALLHLAKAYAAGKGTPSNSYKALMNLEKATRYSDLAEEAHLEIAKIYDNGKGTKRDWTKAAAHYKQALSFEEANEELGEMYFFGVGGLTQNTELALKYLNVAKEMGSFTAKVAAATINSLNQSQYTHTGENYTLTIDDPSFKTPKIIKPGETLSVNVHYNVKETSTGGAIQLFPSQQLELPIKYSSYSPCGQLTGEGDHLVQAWAPHYGSRQFGLFRIVTNANNQASLSFQIPTAVCFLPKT